MQKLQCEICGGSLMMTEDSESAVCESCGMRFKKETIKKMILELSGPVKIDGPVQVEGIQGASSLADRAETLLRFGDTQKAYAAFLKLTDEYPADYRGWWGLTRLTDWDGYFYKQGTGATQPPQEYLRALELSEGTVREEIRCYYEEKIQTVKSEIDTKLTAEQNSRNAKQSQEMARNAYNAYSARVRALQAEEDALAEKIAEARAGLAGVKKNIELTAGTVARSRILFPCFAATAVLCYLTGHYFLVILGVIAALITFFNSFSGRGAIPEAQKKLEALERQTAEADYSRKLAAIPLPDGGEAPDPAAFQTQLSSLAQAGAAAREKQLDGLRTHAMELMKKETFGREIARLYNSKPFKQVCAALEIRRLYASGQGGRTEFVKMGKSAYGSRFCRFVAVYGNMVDYEVEREERKKNKTYWKSAGVFSGRCEVYVDENNYRSLLENKPSK